jgi:hypothetical protein
LTRGNPANHEDRGSRTHARGQSLVEFAIVVPLLLLIMLAAVDFGRVYLGWVNLNNVARVGANFAALNPDAWQNGGDSTLQARYRQLMGKDAQGINCTLPGTLPPPTFPDSGNSYDVGKRVIVELTCSFRLFTPLISNIIGDGAGNVPVTASAVFNIRTGAIGDTTVGGNVPAPTPSPSPEPTAAPTPTATPAPTDPGATPGPSSAPTATPQAPSVSFYGLGTSADSSGGGPPGSVDENMIVGIPNLSVTFTNTTTGVQGNCEWDFGDGSGTSNACSGSVSHTYTTRGLYSVSLSVDGYPASRSNYVLVTCKVPAFAGVRKNSATGNWTAAGFTASNISFMSGSGNYKIDYQSLAGGLINPPGGCDGATVLVGP